MAHATTRNSYLLCLTCVAVRKLQLETKRRKMAQAGVAKSASASHLERGTSYAVRTRDTLKRGSSLANVDLEEESDMSVAQQLAEILSKNAVRVIDLFREWDEDRSGTVDRKEFRRAMPLLGLHVPREVVDALFDEWDPDGSGELTMRELNSKLKRRPTAETSSAHKRRSRPLGGKHPSYGKLGYTSIGRQIQAYRPTSPAVSFGIGRAREPLNPKPLVAGSLTPQGQDSLLQETPPPNKYDPTHLNASLKVRWGGKGIVFGSEPQRPTDGGPFAPKAGPGPAKYNIDTAVGSPDALGRLHTASSYSLTGKWSYTGSLAARSTRVPGPGAYRLPSSIGYQPLAHHKSSTGVSFGRSPSRIQVTPGYKPHGPGLMLPARYQCDTTPGMIY